MNPIQHPQADTAPASAYPRTATPLPAFHSLRAIIPRTPMRLTPSPAIPRQPSYETRAFPIELGFMS